MTTLSIIIAILIVAAVFIAVAHRARRNQERNVKRLEDEVKVNHGYCIKNHMKNNPCACGSGKKYKKCCMMKDKVIQYQNMRIRK
jgi:uncharacterized protein YchJ